MNRFEDTSAEGSVSEHPNLDVRVLALEEIARTTVSALARIEAAQARTDASRTEMHVAIMERIEGMEHKLTQMLDQIAITSLATEAVRRMHDEQRDVTDAQRNLIARHRKDISAVEDQSLLLQRQIVRLDTRMREMHGE